MTTAILDALIVIAGVAALANGAAQPAPEAVRIPVRSDDGRNRSQDRA